MIERLERKSMLRTTWLEVSGDHKTVGIFTQPKDPETRIALEADMLAEFRIEEIWDMAKYALLNADIGPVSDPGILRRQGEAAAAVLYTNKLFLSILFKKGE